MRMFNLAALAAALALMIGSAQAFVFDETPEIGLKIVLPKGWYEEDKGRDPSMFEDLGGAWEAGFTAPSNHTTISLEIVRADTTKFAGAQTWVKKDVTDTFLKWSARKYKGEYSSKGLVESPVTLASGEPAILTKVVKLVINDTSTNVAFVSFERNGFWYVAIVYNVGKDSNDVEPIDYAIEAFLGGTSFSPITVGSAE